MKYLKAWAIVSGVLALSATSAGAVEFTGTTGGGARFSNMQPSLVLGEYVHTSNNGGYYPTSFGNTFGDPGYIGQIRTFGYSSVNYFASPAGGQILAINAGTSAAASILQNLYGGDNRTTFALPNLGGAIAVGAGTSAVGSAGIYTVGDAFGQNFTTLAAAQMPAHDHDLPGGEQTGVAGGGAAIDNRQASLAITYGIVANGYYQQGGGGGGFIGEIQAFAGNFVPNGLLAADGQLLRAADYPPLFSLIGLTYSREGDPSATFRLPDLTGRTAVGASSLSDATHQLIAPGGQIGTNSVTLTEANLPSHTHTADAGTTTAAAGNGQGFSTAQPSEGINYIINISAGVLPTRDREPVRDDYMLGEVTIYAGFANRLPTGWALADGSLLSVADNQALYSLLGNTYGGDKVMFALPDLRGRTVVGAGLRDGVAYVPGQVLGSSSVQLATANLPAHAHSLADAPIAAVPEPATWATMMLGFGVAGAGLRARRRRTTVAFA